MHMMTRNRSASHMLTMRLEVNTENAAAAQPRGHEHDTACKAGEREDLV